LGVTGSACNAIVEFARRFRPESMSAFDLDGDQNQTRFRP
jgi:hypothetical protein